MASPSQGVALGPDAKVGLYTSGNTLGTGTSTRVVYQCINGTYRITGDEVDTTTTGTGIASAGQPVPTFGGQTFVLTPNLGVTPDTLGGAFQPGRKGAKVGLTQFECDLEMQRDIADTVTALGSFHVGGTGLLSGISPALGAGYVVGLIIWPYGLTGVYYDIPYFKLKSFESGFNVEGSQRQTVKLSGKSDGSFKSPGETLYT